MTREKRHAARRAARTALTSRFVVLTGLSGSGKSQAIKALEDLGYFCVDNLPVTLLPMLAELKTEPLLSLPPDAKEKEGFELFDKYNLRMLTIVDKDQRPIGTVTVDDVVSRLLK